MLEPGKVSFIQDNLCWRGADVMGDRPGSLKLGSFKLLDVGGREPGYPGRGCILSDAALCSNVDCSQILLLPNQVVPPTTRRRLVRRSICWHTFLTWVPKVIRQSYVTPRNVGEGVQLGGTPLMVIWGRHFAFCSIEGQARLLASAYYLVDFGLHSQGDVFFFMAAAG